MKLEAREVQNQEHSTMLCYAMKVQLFSVLNWNPTKILKTWQHTKFLFRGKKITLETENDNIIREINLK